MSPLFIMVKRQGKRQRKQVRIPRPVRVRTPQGVLNVKRQWISQALSSAGGLVFKFKLSDVPNFQQFEMFDWYRINAVKLTFHPTKRGSDTTTRPFFAVGQDTNFSNNASSVSSITAAMNRQGMKRFTNLTNRDVSIYLKPKSAVATINSAYQMNKPGTWLSMGSDSSTPSSNCNIDHAGVVGYFDPFDSGVTLDVWATFYLQFKKLDQ